MSKSEDRRRRARIKAHEEFMRGYRRWRAAWVSRTGEKNRRKVRLWCNTDTYREHLAVQRDKDREARNIERARKEDQAYKKWTDQLYKSWSEINSLKDALVKLHQNAHALSAAQQRKICRDATGFTVSEMKKQEEFIKEGLNGESDDS